MNFCKLWWFVFRRQWSWNNTKGFLKETLAVAIVAALLIAVFIFMNPEDPAKDATITLFGTYVVSALMTFWTCIVLGYVVFCQLLKAILLGAYFLLVTWLHNSGHKRATRIYNEACKWRQ